MPASAKRKRWVKPSPPSPTTHPDCEACNSPERTRYTHNPEQYASGDIVRLQESIHTPIDHIFSSSSSPYTSLPSVKRGPGDGKIGKERPAVVIEPFPVAKETVSDESPSVEAAAPKQMQTCLMATYEGTYTFECLPRVLKHFCLPVAPHVQLRSRRNHVHTSPEWQKDHGWLIAFIFYSTGAITGRWSWTEGCKRCEDSSFQIKEERLAELLDLCQERLEEWLSWCEQKPEELERCKAEYVVSAPLTNIDSRLQEPRLKGLQSSRESFNRQCLSATSTLISDLASEHLTGHIQLFGGP